MGDAKKRKKSKRITFICSNGHSVLSDDPKTTGNTLNKYFSSIRHQLATDIPEVNTTFSDYLDPPLQNSFYFDPIITQKIETEISLLPYNKALGLYSTPVKLLKLAKSAIAIPLTDIFNQSVLTGVYPAKRKYAKVIPVYKGEDKTLPENYRLISLLSIYNRLFEKLLYRRQIKFIDKNDFLSIPARDS